MTHRIRGFEVIGQKRMPADHVAAGCEVQVAFITEGEKYGFESFSLTKEQAAEFRERLNYAMDNLYPDD